MVSNRSSRVAFKVTSDPCSLRIYINAKPSNGPHVGNVLFTFGNEINEQFTDFSEINCITEALHPLWLYKELLDINTSVLLNGFDAHLLNIIGLVLSLAFLTTSTVNVRPG